ncbi:hypothetical protein EJ08DRAFT_675339 [Tothia fuscella]|uniref:RanBD1 domain-containing protein n=1 Tax=Tothia fuscella TaxID=1048955 RepID=A0A9P4U298_9PEZI|nr:hypothetical protein EJ08DRAFT_675339 [Tothia fuscella]
MASKRGAGDYLTKDGPAGDDMQNGEPASRATAAQLANRKIKTAKGRRLGAAARTNSSGLSAPPVFNLGAQPVQQPSQSTGFGGFGGGQTQGGLFGTPASSFPPTNGASMNGTGTPNASFPAFGSGAGGSGFNFAAPQTISNPFSNPSAPTNGASNGGINFGFGQPAAATPTNNGNSIFSFGQNNQTSQRSAPPAAVPSFGGFGGSSIFSKPAETPAAAPIFGGFGTPSNNGVPVPSFGTPAPVDDVMSTSPDNSPHKAPAPPNINKGLLPLPSTTAGFMSPTVTAKAPAEGENDKPHIEDVAAETPKPANPFAKIVRPPPEARKPDDTQKQTEKSQTSQSNKSSPFQFQSGPSSLGFGSSIFQPSPSKSSTIAAPSTIAPSPSIATTPQQSQDETPKAAPSFPPASNIFGQTTASSFTPKPSQAASSTTPAAASNPFASLLPSKPAPSAPSFTTSKPAPSAPSFTPKPAPPTNFFASSSTLTPMAVPSLTPGSGGPSNASSGSEETTSPCLFAKHITGVRSPYITEEWMADLMREDDIAVPPPEKDFTHEETRYYYQKAKQVRLNNTYHDLLQQVLANPKFNHLNLSPLMLNYVHVFELIMGEPIKGPLTDLIRAHGAIEGERLYDEERGRIGLNGTSKRKADSHAPAQDSSATQSKKSRLDHANEQSEPEPSIASDTAKKFSDYLSSPSKPAASQPPANGTTSNAPNFFPSSAIKPVSASSSAPESIGAPSAFKPPTFAAAPPGGFLAQFGQTAAKTAEIEKQKRKDAEFDSESDNEEEWERKDAEKQAAKKKELLEAAAAIKPPVFGSSKSTSLAPPSTNGGFSTSRSVSPAPSASGSVFDAPRIQSGAATPKNIFSHLSEAGSDADGSGKGDADDEDEETSEDDGEDNATSGKPASNGGRYGPFSDDDSAPSDEPTGRSLFDRISRDQVPSSNNGNSLFNRISKDDKSDRTPLSTTEGNQTSLFNFTKTSAGDQTWKPDSPIKFGASTTDKSAAPSHSIFSAPGATNSSSLFAPSASGNVGSSLFGFPPSTPAKFPATESTTPATTKPFSFSAFTSQASPTPKASGTSIFAGLGSKPSTTSGSSLFPPSATPSRAPTPGVSDISGTESPAADAEDTTPDEPSRDLVNIEKDFNEDDVLFRFDKVKASKLVSSTDGEGKSTKSWTTQGVGPIAVLQQKGTNRVRLLIKGHPRGNVVLHTFLFNKAVFEQIKTKARFIVLGEGGPENWAISFGDEGLAAEFCEACEAGKGFNN